MSTFTKQSISDACAQAMVAAAVSKARALNVAIVVAVLDEGGHLKAFCRMDSAPLLSIQVAQNKAYTALFGLPSGDLFEAVRGDPAASAALPHVPRVILLGGGLPVRVGDQVAGAIGVGGGSVEQDLQCARAALEQILGGA